MTISGDREKLALTRLYAAQNKMTVAEATFSEQKDGESKLLDAELELADAHDRLTAFVLGKKYDR